jgi:hypothetical protein
MLVTEIKVADIASLFRVAPEVVERWSELFSEFLAPSASIAGEERTYALVDLQVFALVNEMKDWSGGDPVDDYSEILFALNSDYHLEERYRDSAFFGAPIFQEPPCDLDETWTHGILIGGMTLGADVWLAQSFKYAADTLVAEALNSQAAYNLASPILYNYRHAVELYLKIATGCEERTHDIGSLADLLTKGSKRKLSRWAQLFFDQWRALDKSSTTFRYGERWPSDEIWVDLRQLRFVTNVLCKELESIIDELYRDPE